MKHQKIALAAIACSTLAFSAHAAMHADANGNVGFDTAQECDAAVAGGKVKFYQPFTSHPALKRAGEASVQQMTLKDLVKAEEAAKALGYAAASFANGACDLGVGRSNGRDGVSKALIGKYVPFSPDMPVNVYFNAQGQMVRAMMKQCDNNFSNNLPRPTGVRVAAVAASECFATVLTPAKFETKTEQVVKVPATKRFEPVAATFKTVTEQVMVAPESKRQIPTPATYKTISEEVVISPAGNREEPVPATYKMVSETIEVKAASKRIEVVPGTFKTVSEQVMVTPERKELRVTPAVYGEAEDVVADRPKSTRVETVAATFKTVSDQVVARPESVRYEPIAIPMRKVEEQAIRRVAGSRIETSAATYKTVTDQVLVREASKRLVEVPAVYETVTERVKVADATREWKRGRAFLGQAIDVRPLRGFLVGADGKVGGDRVEVGAASGGKSVGTVDQQWVSGNNSNLDDDVMCLVAIPEQFQMVTRQIVKTPASVREVIVPAEYGTSTRQVLERGADKREIEVPATYQTVTRMEVDTDKMRSMGYKFNEQGDIIATPAGERVLRAAAVAAATGSGAAGGSAAAKKSAGAQSGEEAYVREIKLPAEYRTVTRQEIDQPATVRTIEVAGTTKTVKRQVLVTPASTQEVVTPAVFRTVSRQVVDAPASSREIAIPAEFKTIERRVVDKPAATRLIPVAAVTETRTRRVIDQPASVREETIPAVFRTVSRQVIDVPASLKEYEVPAQYETLSYQVKLSDASTQRRAVLCETNATPAKIQEIQRALQTAGFNPGPINGVLRDQTMKAVNQYQQSKGLPVDGFLNLETVKALGVSAN